MAVRSRAGQAIFTGINAGSSKMVGAILSIFTGDAPGIGEVWWSHDDYLLGFRAVTAPLSPTPYLFEGGWGGIGTRLGFVCGEQDIGTAKGAGLSVFFMCRIWGRKIGCAIRPDQSIVQCW